MNQLQQIIPIYIARYKEEYPALEKNTIIRGMTGSQRRDWLRVNARDAFSKENIDTISKDKAVEIFNNTSSICNNNSSGDLTWATNIVDRGVLAKAKELLYGQSDFENRYSVFLGKDKIKDVGEGIASEILCYTNPQKYGIIATSSTKALIILGFTNFPYQRSGGNSGAYALEYFAALQEVLEEFKKDPQYKNADFIDLDYFLYFISQSAIWQLVGGRNGQLWHNEIWQHEGIAGYGTTGIEEKYGESICSADEQKLAQMYTDAVGVKSSGYDKRVAALLNMFINKVKVGDVFVINQGKTAILGYGVVTSGPFFSKNHFEGDPQVYRKVVWVWDIQNLDVKIPEEMKTQFEQAISPMNFKQFQKLIPKGIIADDEEELLMNETERNIKDLIQHKKQIILYGPPGTGKTYSTIIKAHEIIFGIYDPKITYRGLQEKLESRQKNEIDVSQLTWLRAIMLAFHENQKDKVSVDEIKNSKIIQEYSLITNNHTIRNTIWCTLQETAKLDSETVKQKRKSGNEFFDKDSESNWYLTEKGKEYQKSLVADLQEKKVTCSSQFNFVTFHQSFSYEDFVEGIRPVINDDESSQITYCIKPGIFMEICKKAELDPENNYVLVIDEINRGNISKIFGELITLLEDNKRKGEKEEISVKLPYSGEEFFVPTNVYIIGTMNSTDKSIALVDIALRRRFHFKRLNVNYDVIPNEDAKKFLQELNHIVSAIKNPDYEIGHYYFMNIPKEDEGNRELKSVFTNRILPLLEEYFFNDWEALATILGPESIQIERRKKLVWDEDSGEFKKDTGDYDKIFGRCLKPADKVFGFAMNHLGIRTQNLEVTE
jgi:cytidylate kinase